MATKSQQIAYFWGIQRSAFLIALFGEFAWNDGANPAQIEELRNRTGYRYWAGMLNGNGLIERVPGTKNIRLSPCGLWCLSTWMCDDRYGKSWMEENIKNWRRWRAHYSQNPPRF